MSECLIVTLEIPQTPSQFLDVIKVAGRQCIGLLQLGKRVVEAADPVKETRQMKPIHRVGRRQLDRTLRVEDRVVQFARFGKNIAENIFVEVVRWVERDSTVAMSNLLLGPAERIQTPAQRPFSIGIVIIQRDDNLEVTSRLFETVQAHQALAEDGLIGCVQRIARDGD